MGVLGLELFELEDGKLLVNEFAPRVHNSGHWTLDGCEVDQFEQHIRAVAGWPLGPTAPLARTEMLNLLGEEANDWSCARRRSDCAGLALRQARRRARPQDGTRQPAIAAAVGLAGFQ